MVSSRPEPTGARWSYIIGATGSSGDIYTEPVIYRGS